MMMTILYNIKKARQILSPAALKYFSESIIHTIFTLRYSRRRRDHISQPYTIEFRQYDAVTSVSCIRFDPNSTWLVKSRLTRLDMSSVSSRVCSNMTDDEQAIVLACTRLVVCALTCTYSISSVK